MSAALLLADHHQQSPSLAVARNDTNLKCVLGSAILNLQSHVVYVTLLASRREYHNYKDIICVTLQASRHNFYNLMKMLALQASRNEYGNTPGMTATQPDCKEALSAVMLGGESARLKLAEDIEAAAAEAEAARLEEYMQREER